MKAMCYFWGGGLGPEEILYGGETNCTEHDVAQLWY